MDEAKKIDTKSTNILFHIDFWSFAASVYNIYSVLIPSLYKRTEPADIPMILQT